MKTARNSALALATFAGLAFPAFASYDGLVNSVHFYNEGAFTGGKVDFGRAPIGVRMKGWTNEPSRFGTTFAVGWDWDAPKDWDPSWVKRQAKRRAKARNLEVRGNLSRSISAYGQMFPVPGIRAFVKDREELFQKVSNPRDQALQAYLRGRYVLEFGEERKAVAILQSIKNPPAYLRPHIDYALATIEQGGRTATAERYLSVYRRHPKSSRAESALIMAARTLVQADKREKPTQIQIEKADRILDRLLAEFPRTRFKENAIGWKGRCAYLTGKYDIAANHYSQLARSKDPSIAWMGYSSLADLCIATKRTDKLALVLLRQWGLPSKPGDHLQGGHRLIGAFESLTPTQARFIQKEIRRDPRLLESYVGFRIENTRLTPAKEQNLMAFATSALSSMKHPPASLVSRIAQINYNAGRYSSARLLANRTLSLKPDLESAGRARYVLAGSLARQGKHREAIREGEKLLSSTKIPYLRHGIAEFLALQNERHGDPLKAFDLYVGLGYRLDVAYLADALLTPQQLESSLNRGRRWKPGTLAAPSPEYYMYQDSDPLTPHILRYTLGMRYLRQEKYDKARQAFLKIPLQVRKNWGITAKERKDLLWHDNTIGYDKAPPVRDPLIVVAKLSDLTSKIKQARSSNAKAQAIYDKAAYIYREKNLLFYSPGLWKGNRAFMIRAWWNDDVANRPDEEALGRHVAEHECVAHSLRLCEEIIQKYPKSAVMPKALYTAALSAQRLSNLATSERAFEDRHLMQISINRLDRLQREFPEHTLAKPALKYKHEFIAELKNPYR